MAGSNYVAYNLAQARSDSEKLQARNNIGAAAASDVTALRNDVDALSNVSVYTAKGEATIAELNAGPAGIQAGWAYILMDAGTLTDGSLVVKTGDTVAWDGSKWFMLVDTVYYASKTSIDNLSTSIAKQFDPTRTSENPYKAGESIIYNDRLKTFKVDHYGAWSEDDVYADSEIERTSLAFEAKKHFTSYDLIVGVYASGSVGSAVTINKFSSTYASNGYVKIPVSAGEHITIKSLPNSTAVNNYLITDKLLNILEVSGNSQVSQTYEIDVEQDGFLYCNTLPENFEFTGLFDERLIYQRMSKVLEKKVSFDGDALEIGWVYRNDPVTKVQPSLPYRDTGCFKIAVKKGDVISVKSSASSTDYALIITDTQYNVFTRYSKGTLDVATVINIDKDGYACVNSLPAKFSLFYLASDAKNTIFGASSKDVYTYANLTASKTFGSRNIGFVAPSIGSSGLNRAMSIKVKKGDQLKITSKVQGSANLLYLTDANNIIKTAYTKEMVDCLIEVKHDGEALVSCENNGTFLLEHRKGVFSQANLPDAVALAQPAADGSSGSEFDAENMTTQDIYDALDALSAKYPYLLTSRTLGKDASGTLDVKEYVFAQRTFLAWERDNYPKMYAFKHDSSVVYCDKPSPRVGDSLYLTAYIGTASLTVSSVSPNAWTLSDANEYERDVSADVEPTLIYTMVGNGLYVYYSNGYYRNASATQSGDDIVYDGTTYHRNHLYDTRMGEDYASKICIGCAEHGPTTDPRDTAITLYNLVRDLCENPATSDFLAYLKTECLLAFIPVINPWGYDNGVNGRRNSNGVNINRNYNTPGWSLSQEDPGAYPGSEIETQYAMNLFAERKWDGTLSIHCLGEGNNYKYIMFGAKSVDPVQDMANGLSAVGYRLAVNMGDNPQTSCTSNAYQKLVGTSGVLIELNRGPDAGQQHTAVIETLNCTYLMSAIKYAISL